MSNLRMIYFENQARQKLMIRNVNQALKLASPAKKKKLLKLFPKSLQLNEDRFGSTKKKLELTNIIAHRKIGEIIKQLNK